MKYMKQLLLTLFAFVSLFTMQAQTATAPVLPKEDYVVTISTSYGNIVLLLYDQTPLHKKNFIDLAQKHFYDGTTFHRVILDFMIQGGDPNSKDSITSNDGIGGPGYTIPAEFNPNLKHDKGALAAARMGDEANPQRASSGSQFYIVQNKKGTPFLDNSYTVFGQTISGFDVIDKIAQVQVDGASRPLKNVPMKVTAVKMKTKKIIKLYDCEWFYKV
ncbi:peptidylprolyl isomerase [Cytophaga hutchinsonii]|uniref:Peptidyl-prolyl cis-trans isomerase n=1 Tax=Cytophaga hutchinsonii (strain ATCC 33406 / DSM 1761 / CIP 103989 / NBRC 15051 / NCIMB 9469 / D465) TaxID=269798 RepID=A0A6N4SNB8_CYTH3|nr:peptidylprolyl isomerase A (peptidyl-prolyl cis-trans isomerase) [Cytophaga hutchinsonii ATCC 33406]